MKTRTTFGVGIGLGIGATMALFSSTAFAATYTVTSASGSCAGTPGTLVWAIDKANTDGTSSTVTLDPSLAGQTIPLVCPLVVIEELSFVGHPGVTVSGATLAGMDILTFDAPGATHDVQDLQLVGGTNTRGINIEPNQLVYLFRSTVRDNVNVGAVTGAGIRLVGSALTLDRTTLLRNKTPSLGGAVYAAESEIRVFDSSFDKNEAANGGGMFVEGPSGNIVVNSSTFYANKAGQGGAISLFDGPTGAFLDVDNSTFSTNGDNATVGGAVYLGDLGWPANSDASIVNSTFSNNRGQFASAIAVIDGFASVYNTAFYRIAATAPHCYVNPGADMGGHHNIWNDTSCPLGTVWLGSKPNTDPLLNGLANNGGPTQTHKPKPASPVMGAGSPLFCPPDDQRGVARTTCWMGSYEN